MPHCYVEFYSPTLDVQTVPPHTSQDYRKHAKNEKMQEIQNDFCKSCPKVKMTSIDKAGNPSSG